MDQIVGQDQAVEIVRLAARQRRFVLLIGDPGTGKSMLGAAMSELLEVGELDDILVFSNPDNRVLPLVQTLPAGEGRKIVEESKSHRKRSQLSIQYFFWVSSAATLLIGLFYMMKNGQVLYGVAGLFFAIGWFLVKRFFHPEQVVEIPKILVDNGGRKTAPFVDATGFHSGALLGDVRHDPYQSGGAETPPHELIEAGAIHKAHKGVLFIDEASALSEDSQHYLLTAIQEKRLPITGRSIGSSGAMVHTEPVPCDFVLVLAGNREDVDKIHPALRSRIRGYGYEIFTADQMPDTEENRDRLARFVAQEVAKDGKIPHFTFGAVSRIIEEGRRRAGDRGRISLRLRELGGLVRASGDVAVSLGSRLVEPEHVEKAREIGELFHSKMVEQLALKTTGSPSDGEREGRIHFVGTLQPQKYFPASLTIFPSKVPSGGKPKLITRAFDGEDREYLWNMVKTILSERLGLDIADSDLFMDTPTSLFQTPVTDLALPVAVATYARVSGIVLPPDLAVVGHLRIDGTVAGVEFAEMKIGDLGRSGMNTILIPEANENDLSGLWKGEGGKEPRIISLDRIEKLPDWIKTVIPESKKKP